MACVNFSRRPPTKKKPRDAPVPHLPIKTVGANVRRNLKAAFSSVASGVGDALLQAVVIHICANAEHDGAAQRGGYQNVFLREQAENFRGVAFRRRLLVYAGERE